MAILGGVQRCLLGLLIALVVTTPLEVPVSAAGLPGPPDTLDALHEVAPGDNLHLIAGYYYGDARQWERVWRANRQQVPNPNVIERGTLLLVPATTVPDEPYAEFVARVRRPPDRVDVSAEPNTRRPSQ
ncbi:MAG TPA: hypothetical protein VLT62_10240 [Candidatus Methylomirabilis sp.]|nr:hypothetical protein [Candidatus Methylomirabilis sp.]